MQQCQLTQDSKTILEQSSTCLPLENKWLKVKLGGIPYSQFLLIHGIFLIPVWQCWLKRYTAYRFRRYPVRQVLWLSLIFPII